MPVSNPCLVEVQFLMVIQIAFLIFSYYGMLPYWRNQILNKYVSLYKPASSIAQCGSGNFKKYRICFLWLVNARSNPLWLEYRLMYLSVCLSVRNYWFVYCLCVFSICLSVCLTNQLSIKLWVYQTITLYIYQSTYLSTSLYLSVYLPNETSLQDCLIFWSWQHQERNNSARLPSNTEHLVLSWQPRTKAFCDCSITSL